MVSKLMALCMLVISILTGPAMGQVTINQSDFILTPGSVYTTSANGDVDTNLWAGFTSGSGGGHLWDFSAIPFGVASQTKVVNPNVVPFANQFTGATGAWELLGGQSWTMFQSVPNQLYSLGNVSVGPWDPDPGIDTLVTVFDMPSLQVQFPVTSSSSWTSLWQYTQVYALYSIQIRDSVKYSVDAWGTIKYGNKQVSALRVRVEWTIKQTTIFPGAPNQTTTTTMLTYQFMSKEYGGVTLTRTPSAQRTYVGAAADYRFVQTTTPVYEVSGSTLPDEFSVAQNSPNPFNPETSIEYSLPTANNVTFEVLNVLGQRVWNEDFGMQAAGNYQVRWNGRNDHSEQLPSGVYFYRLTSGDKSVTRKMILLK